MISHLVDFQKLNLPITADKQFLTDQISVINSLNLGITLSVTFPNTNASTFYITIEFGEKEKEIRIVGYDVNIINYGD